MATFQVRCICVTAGAGAGADPGSGFTNSAFSGIAFVEVVDPADAQARHIRLTRGEVANRIRNGDRFFVSSDNSILPEPQLHPARVAWLEIGRSPHGTEIVRTVPDNTDQDNLYALPTCDGCAAHAAGHRFHEGHEDEDSGNAEPDSEPPDEGPPDGGE